MLTVSMSRRNLLTSAAMAATVAAGFGLDQKLAFISAGTCGDTARADDRVLQV